MAAVTRRRRSYVAPPGALRRRLQSAPIPLPPPGPAVTVGVALVIAGTAFVSRGGSQLERTTWTEVGVMLIGAAVCAAALALPRSERAPERLRGAWVLIGFAGLTAFTALSISWSLMPSDSWIETSRTLSYLAALAGGLALGRLAPGRWSAVIGGVAIGIVALCAWSILTKVFPAALAPDEPFARLRPPSDYWNSVGLTAAMGVPPLLWLAARRSGYAAFNALAWPGLGIVITCLLLSVSRGALLALGIVLVCWFALVPLRLRAAIALGGVLVATVPLLVWAFAQDGLTTDGATMALRIDAGQGLGALILLLAVTLTAAGLAVGFMSDVHTPSSHTRARAGRVLIGAIAVVPAVAILLLANAPGGIDGQVSKAWKQATDPATSGPSNSPERLTSASSNRARYWREAMKVHGEAPVLGSGAGAYGTLRLRYREDYRTARHAHGYVVQTLADLGWVGLGLSLLAAIAWLVAMVRVLGIRRRDRGLPWDAERVGLATLAAVALLFGIHSTIDWTWFVPANVVPALICAGFVASRSTLRERLGAPATVPASVSAPAPSAPTPVRPSAPARGVSRVGLATAALVVVIALAGAWSALQPVRSANAMDEAAKATDAGALPRAASIAQIAHDRNPLAVDPYFQLASIERAQNRLPEANRSLQAAIELEPANPEVWRRLGDFRASAQNDLQGALRAYQAAYYLDPKSPTSLSDVVTTSRRIAMGG